MSKISTCSPIIRALSSTTSRGVLAAAVLALGLWASLGAAQAQQTEPILLGLSTALSGPAAYTGQQDRWGAELAIKEINAAGGVLGRPLALTVQDNACNPAQAAQSAQRLLADKVVAMMGGLCSSATLAIMPIIKRQGIPFLVPISSAGAITDQSGVGGNEWTFRTAQPDPGLARALVNFLVKEGKTKSVAIVAEDSDYGRGAAQVFSDSAKKAGLQVVSSDYTPLGTPDFTTILTRLRSQQPDAVALYIQGADTANFMRQYVSSGLKARITGRVQFGDFPEAIVKSGALNGLVVAIPYDPRAETEGNQRFVKQFTTTYDKAPMQHSFNSYEGTRVLADAIKRAGSTDPAAIRDALAKTSFASALGADLTFDDHHQAYNNAVIMGVRDGEVKVLSLSKP